MVAQTEPVLSRIASSLDADPPVDEIVTTEPADEADTIVDQTVDVSPTDETERPATDTVVSEEGEVAWASEITPYQAITLEIAEEDQNIYQASAETIAGWAHQVVQTEAPVHRQLIYSRICDGVGLSKAGSNVTAAIDKGIELALSQGQIRAVDEIREDEEGDKRYYWFYYQTDTNLIPARNWEAAPDRNLLLVSDEEIESMARVLFGDTVQLEDMEQATRQIWSGLALVV